MKKALQASLFALLFVTPQKDQVWTANIDQIRQAARMIPGRAPLRINVVKFAESRRTKNFSVKGAPAEPSEMIPVTSQRPRGKRMSTLQPFKVSSARVA